MANHVKVLLHFAFIDRKLIHINPSRQLAQSGDGSNDGMRWNMLQDSVANGQIKAIWRKRQVFQSTVNCCYIGVTLKPTSRIERGLKAVSNLLRT